MSESDKGRRALMVVDSRGRRHRFLRGMITHDLMQRGLGFDDAYAMARAIRGRLEEREEVTKTEIRDLLQQQLEEMTGGELPAARPRDASDLQVYYQGEAYPFSRGLLARSIHAAGVDLDRAYLLVTELEGELRKSDTQTHPSSEIARRVGELLEQLEGKAAAQRYRLVRSIRHLPRPTVIYIGGASGTGKSTLALGLSPLLRIYRVNATDTIRQVMRMVFSPTMLPALHGSSFEVQGDERVSPHDQDFEQRLLATFEEQSTRVNVGVRAVVERAIAENMSLLVEGVHLYPPLVPFGDLEGAAYQVPMMVAAPDPEIHRTHFLTRARFGGRRAERYVESFAAIRTIHDFLLHQAEQHDVPLVATGDSEPPVNYSLRLITSVLRQRLPSLAESEWEQEARLIPTLLIIIDGLADRPARALGGRTPLEAADLPTLDRLAAEGQCGLADPIAPGVVADTAAGSLALFGQSPLAMKRGPVEALGAGLEPRPGDVALRGNFATLNDDGFVVDRRAGRVRERSGELAEALDRLPLPGALADEVEIRVRAATEHRLSILLRGDGLSSAIEGSDPGDGAAPGPPLIPRPTDPGDARAVYTARVLALFEQGARKVLARHPLNRQRAALGMPSANAVLTRGAGRIHRLIPLEQAGIPLRLACVGGDRTVLGLASWLGAEVLTEAGMTANLDTDLGAKMSMAGQALARKDLVILHLKGADIAAHDQRPDLKAAFLEKIDTHLGELLARQPRPLRIAVASDHATLSESGQHAADPLPVLIWGEGIEPDKVKSYDERSVAGGDLQQFPLQMLLGRLFNLG